MQYVSTYNSPLGEILIAVDDTGLVGLWFKEQKNYKVGLDKTIKYYDNKIIIDVKDWLNRYFKGERPSNKELVVHFRGTKFQNDVWKILMDIPYGNVVTYKDVALELMKRRGISNMSYQAIGSAISRNRISIVIPCHRVIGSNKKLIGYAGGLDKKEKLLDLENK